MYYLEKVDGVLIQTSKRMFSNTPKPCNHCKDKAEFGGMHPFKTCNVLPDNMKLYDGACANCVFQGRWKTCSRRKKNQRSRTIKSPTGPSRDLRDFQQGGRRNKGTEGAGSCVDAEELPLQRTNPIFRY